ncbi:MAG: peptidylprolyl isomerase [Phycisphaerales bacterium]|nr:peptidylprolyl isomerase [Phycisphaerales bacterium]
MRTPATLARMSYPTATIETDRGTITVELWDDVAPEHVQNFLALAGDEFYDGVIFHRIIPDFVIQGGCPDGTGTGGGPRRLKAEFNDREHHPGVLSMARSTDPDSASSQFFICLTREHCRHLDGQYTGFGKVTDGMDVVEAIAAIDVDPHSGRPEGDPPHMVKVRPVE